MESTRHSEVKKTQEELSECITALGMTEDKYRRGEVELKFVVYAIDRVQNALFNELQTRGIISADVNYIDNYRSALTDDGQHYTKILSPETTETIKPKTPEQKVIDLLSKIGAILPTEVAQSALEKARDPEITEETLTELLGNLLTQAFAKLNKL
jgi:hypothetical protein